MRRTYVRTRSTHSLQSMKKLLTKLLERFPSALPKDHILYNQPAEYRARVYLHAMRLFRHRFWKELDHNTPDFYTPPPPYERIEIRIQRRLDQICEVWENYIYFLEEEAENGKRASEFRWSLIFRTRENVQKLQTKIHVWTERLLENVKTVSNEETKEFNPSKISSEIEKNKKKIIILYEFFEKRKLVWKNSLFHLKKGIDQGKTESQIDSFKKSMKHVVETTSQYVDIEELKKERYPERYAVEQRRMKVWKEKKKVIDALNQEIEALEKLSSDPPSTATTKATATQDKPKDPQPQEARGQL